MVKQSDCQDFWMTPEDESAFESGAGLGRVSCGVDSTGPATHWSRLNTIEMLGLLDDPRSHPELKNNVRKFLADRLGWALENQPV